MKNNTMISSRFTMAQPGIAIGPILFVVAILAVLVGALAAGSGGFGSSTANDANRVNGSTLIEQGTSIKTAADRLLVNGYLATDIYFSQTYTSGNAAAALFAPTGGGMTAQNPPANTIAAGAAWSYVLANLPSIGSTGANDLVTAIQVKTDSVCKAINSVIFGSTATQATAIPTTTHTVTLNTMGSTCSDTQIGTSTAGCNLSGNLMDLSDLTATMAGRVQGCIKDSAGNDFYYQLLSAS